MTSKTRSEPVVLVLDKAERALYAPAAVLFERPSGREGSGSAVIEVCDSDGNTLNRVLSNGVPLCRASLPLLVEPRGRGYRGLPPVREN